MNFITVSIFILTYNQEKFIAQTIESILMQKTNFSFQLVIGEDCSTDATRVICEKYASDYGDKIMLLPSPHINIGLIANYMRTIKECNGKYIAICDGDDYWIDVYKLQKQVDLLENNPNYSIVHTGVKFLFANGEFEDFINLNNLKYNSFEDLICFNFIFSVTAVFRNVQFTNPLPAWVEKYPYGDWSTYLWTIKDKGQIYYIPDITSVYRKNIGVSSGLKDSYSIDVNILKDIYSYINCDINKEILLICIFDKEWGFLVEQNAKKEYKKAFVLFIRLIKQKKEKLFWIKYYLHSLVNNFFRIKTHQLTK
ncbi:glycosyltransferase [Flavobacterium sp. 83]|uniref:glycosyltransferase n=1 Tax=Flavobacterium sp. 83 TaxID=1131812 RepID=UPI00055668CE|nr:glycosyltransferase [Flavobacterium sp. 83]